jgi:AraC-like DNA-binding protein
MAAVATNATSGPSKYGTATFTEASDWECAFGGGRVQLTITGNGVFKARLTSLHLGHLEVLRGSEELPRIAYVSLPASRVFVSFPTGEVPLIWEGIELRPGDFVLHSRGERMHQRTTGASRWGVVSLPAQRLSSCGKPLTGRKMSWPLVGRVLQPQPIAARRLLGLHARAGRLAESKDKLLVQSKFARALEQELVYALVDCLTTDDASREIGKRHANIMVRFEDVLTNQAGHRLSIPELCATIGVSERTFRGCCAEFLGMGPIRYLLLRRLNMARSALRRADPARTSVAEIARNYQFSELGRFAVNYRAIFGEAPSTTLRGAPGG